MSESFYSERFGKNVWLTNHAIESMAKRRITLPEVKVLVETGEHKLIDERHGWIYYQFPERDDNLVCAAVVEGRALVVKTIMIEWQQR